jgi:colicin import membrane protein
MRMPLFVAALLLAAPVLAQRVDAPLGDLIGALPMPEDESPPPALPAPAPPPRIPSTAIPPGGVGVAELPPSDLDALPPADPTPETRAEAETDARREGPNAWELERERRRAAVNEEEAPLVAELNEAIARRHEENRRASERAEADRARVLEEREVAIRRAEAEHRRAVEAHRREVERIRRDHEARVAACLAGDRTQCAQPR